MKQIIHTDNAPAAIGAYSQAVRSGNTVWLSGQIPLVPETGELVPGDFAAQATQVFKNLQAVIKEAGGTFENVVKINAYLTDLTNFATFQRSASEIYATTFPSPCRSGRSQFAQRGNGRSRSDFGVGLKQQTARIVVISCRFLTIFMRIAICRKN